MLMLGHIIFCFTKPFASSEISSDDDIDYIFNQIDYMKSVQQGKQAQKPSFSCIIQN